MAGAAADPRSGEAGSEVAAVSAAAVAVAVAAEGGTKKEEDGAFLAVAPDLALAAAGPVVMDRVAPTEAAAVAAVVAPVVSEPGVRCSCGKVPR